MSLFSKIIGGIIFVIGLLIVIVFPSMRDYQPGRMSLMGILFGLAMMGIGAILVIF